ncbi:MAG: hypothetical protein AAF125_24370, partial [Chloroflexota bacterium]
APLANGEPSNSLDGRITVTIECYAPGEEGYTVTATDNDTGETITLGEVTDERRGVTGDPINYVFVSQWLDDITVELRAETGGGTYNWRYVWLADATTPDSLAHVAADYVSRPVYLPDPARYEWADEDGVTETFRALAYDVASRETVELYEGPCLPRDDLGNPLSCHMVTVMTNASFTPDVESFEQGVQNPSEAPSRVIFNVGDSAREIKTIEVRTLPSGDLLYTVDTLGSGYAVWLAADTAAVFNLAFDFESGGFGGVFLRFDEDGTIVGEESFALPFGEDLTQRPSWMETDTP